MSKVNTVKSSDASVTAFASTSLIGSDFGESESVAAAVAGAATARLSRMTSSATLSKSMEPFLNGMSACLTLNCRPSTVYMHSVSSAAVEHLDGSQYSVNDAHSLSSATVTFLDRLISVVLSPNVTLQRLNQRMRENAVFATTLATLTFGLPSSGCVWYTITLPGVHRLVPAGCVCERRE